MRLPEPTGPSGPGPPPCAPKSSEISLFVPELKLIKKQVKPRWKFGDLQLKQPETLEGFVGESSAAFREGMLQINLMGQAVEAEEVG